MKHFNVKKRAFLALLMALVFCCSNYLHAADITHNISSADLIIAGTSTDNYIITGSTTTNKVEVGSGYQGTITLQNCSIVSPCGGDLGDQGSENGYSPFLVNGVYDGDNHNPVTNVNIVLDGNNYIGYYGTMYAALQVDQGAQINISAINPNDNTSGFLFARANVYEPGTKEPEGGAAIGAPSYTEQGIAVIYKPDGTVQHDFFPSAGGNIIINSGTIKAWGGHGAGIGGGHTTYYNGIIILTGGVIEARGGYDSAGIGSGCPQGDGIKEFYADKSAIIALPPCDITAFGAGKTAQGGSGAIQFPSLGLNGTKFLTYVNDPAKPLITIHTEDFEKNANVYLDLTETPGLQNVFDKVYPTFDLTHVLIGRTGVSDGLMKVHGLFQNTTTFFTDASSTSPASLGRPYMPVSQTTSGAETIILPLFEGDIRFTDYPSSLLVEGYSSAEAQNNAYCLKIEYKDNTPLTSLTFKLQLEAASSFKDLIFLAADSVTVIPAPTTLSQNDVIYIVAPLKDSKMAGVYKDVILIRGAYNSVVMSGYIRRISDQLVVKDDTKTNDHIKVTADPVTFSELFPTSKTVNLTLNITHTGLSGVPYDPTAVTAKYIITSEQDYAAALAATPLNQWTDLVIPSADGVNSVTTASFAGKAAGTYYIHWYVVSSIVMAHSQDVTDPALNYGGFGKYNIIAGRTVTYNGNTNDGGAVPVDMTKYPPGNSVTVLGNTGLLTKTDATFIGWSFGISAVVTTPAAEPADLMNANDQFVISTDATLYAVWAIDKNGPGGGKDSIPDYKQFGVTYNGNGNTSGTAPTDANIYSSGDNVTAKGHGSLVRTGGAIPIVFAGWTPTPVSNVLTLATAADTTTAFVRAGAFFTITGNTTMYAVWSEDANGNGNPDVFEKGYNVTYDGNGATAGTAPIDPATYLTGMSVIAKAEGSLTKDNAVFLGWSETAVSVVTTAAQEAAANIIHVGSSFIISANTTLYAVWGEDVNGPDGGGDGTPDYKQFGVTYNPSGATGSVVDNNIYSSGTNVILKAKENLVKTNCIFLGWNSSVVADITTQAEEDALVMSGSMKQPNETFVIAGHTTWYAVWAVDGNGNEIPDYKEKIITYHPGMLHGVVQTQTVANGSKIALTNMNTQALNYVLLGWHTQKMPTIGSLAMENYVTTAVKFYKIGDSLTVTGDMTLFAVWAVDKNKDGFPDYGGTVIVPTLIEVSTRVGEMTEGVTGNEAVTDTHVWAHENTLYIHSEKAARANIYTLSGRLFKQMNVPAGVTSEQLARGIYVVEIDGSHYKVVVQ